MKLKHITCITFFLCACLAKVNDVQAQSDILFTQYIFNSLSVNPAYAGYKEEWFAQLVLRNQWVSMDNAPKTGQLSIDGVVNPTTKTMGFGLQINADKLGPQGATSMFANYAFRLRLNGIDTRRLSFGLGAGFAQYSLDGSILDAVNQDDISLSSGKESNLVPDLSFGIHYSSPKFYLGASMMNLLSAHTNASFFKLDNNPYTIGSNRHFYFMAGALINLDWDLKLRPSLLFKEDFKGPTSLDLSAIFIFSEQIWLGGSYRTGMQVFDREYRENQKLNRRNSLSGLGQFYVSQHLRIGYSYDYVLGQLSSLQNGTHEITIGLVLPKKSRRKLRARYF